MLRTHVILGLIVPMLVATFGCADSDAHTEAAKAVSVEPFEAEPNARLVTVSGTVTVFGRDEVSLSGVAICEETTEVCTTTDSAGGFELFAPSGHDLVLSATGRDIFETIVPARANPDHTLSVRVMPRVAGAAFAELADGDLSPSTGMVFVVARDGANLPVSDMWLTIRDFAAWGPVYTEPGIVPALDRKLTGSAGIGAYMELPPGIEEIGIGGDGRQCSSPHWPTTDENLFAVPVRANAITWLNVVCD